jgi:hypothetical protein
MPLRVCQFLELLNMHNRRTDLQWCANHWSENTAPESILSSGQLPSLPRQALKQMCMKTHRAPRQLGSTSTSPQPSTRGRKIWERPSFILRWNCHGGGEQQGYNQEMNTATCVRAGKELRRRFEFFCVMVPQSGPSVLFRSTALDSQRPTFRGGAQRCKWTPGHDTLLSS